MDMTNKEYGQYVNAKSKPSPLGRDMLWAFVVGGLICTIGQALLNLYRNAGMGRDDAGSAVSMTLIFAAALLTGLGLFDKLAKRAGAGTLVPSPALPTPWSRPPWSSKARVWSPAPGPSCSRWRGRCWFSASVPPSSTG